MKYVHISERFNRDSILQRGLMPTPILLPSHKEGFKKAGYINNACESVLYLWESCEKDNKFIKDMCFCKTWITPRNKVVMNRGYNYINPKTNLYPYDKMVFDVYEVSNINNVCDDFIGYHVQNPDDDISNTLYGMDDRYAHDDKRLVLSKSVEKNIRIIKTAYMSVEKNGKINVKIRS